MPSMVTESSTSLFVASKPTSGFKFRPYSMCVHTALIESSRASALTTRLQGWRMITRAPPPIGGRSAHQIEARTHADAGRNVVRFGDRPDVFANTGNKIRGPDDDEPSPDRSSTKPLFHRVQPDRASPRCVRIFSGEEQIHAGQYFRGIDTPAGLDRDILLAVDLKQYRHRGHARPGREFP